MLHAYAGPLGLLSFGFGATGAAIGHSQNLWRFARDRWEVSATSGGGGDAPPRFFSTALWGTIVFPDEVAQLDTTLTNQVLTHSPFSQPLTPSFWTRWDANKHLIYMICDTIATIAAQTNARACAQNAITILANAIALHEQIEEALIDLRDDTNVYQTPWRAAAQQLLSDNDGDFDYLELLS